MSDNLIKVKQLELNWNNMAPGPIAYAGGSMTLARTDHKLFFNLEITPHGGRACNAHVNLDHGFVEAHVTILETGKPKTNYWYKMVKQGQDGLVRDADQKPKNRHHPETVKFISQVPPNLKNGINNLLEALYTGVFQ
jgi:hypothetical protein